MNKWFIISGILCATLLSVLYGGSSANAVENPHFWQTTELELAIDGCNTINISRDWSTIITNSPTLTQTQKDDFFDSVYEGYYALITDVYSETQIDAYLYFRKDSSSDPIPTLSLINQTANYYYYLQDSTGNGYERIRFYLNSSCEPVVLYESNYMAIVSGNQGSSNPTRFYSFIISTEVELDSNIDPEWVPEIQHQYDPETPEENNVGTGLIPVSDYTVNDLDISIIDITSQSEKILYKIDECYFQLPNNSYGDNFTEYMYDCDNPTTIEHTFADGYAGYNIIHRLYSSETGLWYESTLVLDVDGSTFSGSIGKIEEDIFAKCINGDAPYLHFKECLGAFGKITNSMSFGAIKPLGAFRYEPTSECRNLEVLGDWINLNNKEVCPQFSENVRNVVTPFISFGLSLGVLGAILTKSSKEYM